MITTGRRGKKENILLSKKKLENKKVQIHSINRGGDVTYHGPGQLVGYLIFDLKNYGKDIRGFISNLENIVVDILLNNFNIEA